MRSMPMPAANSMDAHANMLKSGLECWGPSLIRPYREPAMNTTNTRKTVAATK